MVRIPYIKIPSVRVGSIGPTSGIGTGGATPAPPTPITYLTQWKIVGNSEVHTDPYLTSWKVSGNSVVDNNTIMSCGDLGQDGKYHVKISNGVNVYDIPLTEPLRKVNSIADKIEFSNGSAVVTRYFDTCDLGELSWSMIGTNTTEVYRLSSTDFSNSVKQYTASQTANVLCALYTAISANGTYSKKTGISVAHSSGGAELLLVYDENFNQSNDAAAFKTAMDGVELIYELATPITELIDVSPFPVSPTDTYTSANVVPFSAFEHTENKEIWSCGEYNPIDGKWHILVQPQGGSIADIALTEPLRKVNDVADTIEFPSETEGKALVTRNLKAFSLDGRNWNTTNVPRYVLYITDRELDFLGTRDQTVILCNTYTATTFSGTYNTDKTIGAVWNGTYNLISIRDTDVVTPQTDITGEAIFKLTTPTTELVDAPQIAEADSYSCIISQGGKAVSWSSFETKSE